ncbi:hypothetical protein GGI20_005266 [Coemansia sp. BCRC 34301]|nr:hypothetical protein GGI20_005266 [Coemansia sp. BCRC 34301]
MADSPSPATPVAAKRGRGRPRKHTAPAQPLEEAPVEEVSVDEIPVAKRRQGRPRKNTTPVQSLEEVVIEETPAEEATVNETPVTKKRLGRPRKDAPREEPLANATPTRRGPGRSRKTPAVPSEPVDELPPPPVAATPEKRGRGRPRKFLGAVETLPATEGRSRSHSRSKPADGEEEVPLPEAIVTPEKHGRGRPSRSIAAVAPDVSTLPEEALATELLSPSLPAKRGRPSNKDKAAREAALLAARESGVPVVQTPTKSGRGRGRGRGRGTASPRPPVRRCKQSKGASGDNDEYENASTEDNDYAELEGEVDPEEEDDDNNNSSFGEATSDVPRRTPRKKPRGAATAAGSTPRGKHRRRTGSNSVIVDANRLKRLDGLWSGPLDSDRLPHPYRIDVGLDRATWSVLQGMQVKRACFEIETDTDMLASAMPATGKVHVAMLSGAGEPLSRDGSPFKLGPLDVHELIGDTEGWLANTGLSACSVDWVPVRSGGEQSGSECRPDFVAVGGVSPPAGSTSSLATCGIGQYAAERVKGSKPGSVQIWRVDTKSKSAGGCRLDMILTHTFGRCIMLKWCPVSLAAAVSSSNSEISPVAPLPVIGYLAAVFGDGHLRVCAVPNPSSVRSGSDCDPVCVRWPKLSLVDISAPRGIFTSLAWANSDLLVAGTSLGGLTAWLLGSSIRAQHANWKSSGSSDRGEWPYLIPAEFFESDDCQQAPVINHTLHSGMVTSVDTYCGGDSLVGGGAALFTQVSMSNIQIISTSDGGRVLQTLAAFPARHHHTIAIIPSKARSAAVFWPTRSCLYADADNCVRLTTGSAITNPGDPWVFAGFGRDATAFSSSNLKEEANIWNSTVDLSALYALKPDGAVLDMSTSEFHPYLLVSSSDGTVMIQNAINFDTTAGRTPMYRKIYSLLWYPFLKQAVLRESGEDNDDVAVDGDVGSAGGAASEDRLVCLGRLPIVARPPVPRSFQGGYKGGKNAAAAAEESDEGSKRAKSSKSAKAASLTLRVYPAQTAVQACAWSRNPSSASWIATVCAVGLLRIEDVSP